MEIRPQPGPQSKFLESSADIAIYGGAAGGGKSWGLLLEALRHTGNPDFGAVIFRRTSPQITNEGGLWDESVKLYPFAGGTPVGGTMDWRFPSGANIGFRHLQHEVDKLSWMGAQVCMIGFDELTHFTRSQFFYLMSRNRSLCGVRPYIRATCNPDASSWVAEFIGWWINQDTGFPIPERSGVVRWFVAVGNDLVWGDRPEELKAKFPGLHPKSVTFIPAKLSDNQILMKADPGYLANLMAMPRVERERLLHGNWKVMMEGLVFGDLLLHVIDPCKIQAVKVIAGQDWGWNNPAATLIGVLDAEDDLFITDEVYGSNLTMDGPTAGMPPATWDKDLVCLVVRLCREVCQRYQCPIERVWCDPAEPRCIEKFRKADLPARGADNSLMPGIATVNTRIRAGRLKVFRTCIQTIREAGLYRNATPEEQKLVGEKPIDANNHAMSALRYMIHEQDRFRTILPNNAPRVVIPEKPVVQPPDYARDYRLTPPKDNFKPPEPIPEPIRQLPAHLDPAWDWEALG